MDIELGILASPAGPRENTRGAGPNPLMSGRNSADQRFGQSRRRWPRGHWTDSPVRGPLPRHFSMLAFLGELPCQRGAAAVAALSSKPTTTVGAAIDKAGNLLTAHGYANPVADVNSLDDTKAYRDQMMGNNRPLVCLCDSVLVNYLGTSASRM